MIVKVEVWLRVRGNALCVLCVYTCACDASAEDQSVTVTPNPKIHHDWKHVLCEGSHLPCVSEATV